MLTAVPTQIISPRDCKPIVSVVQDVALGIHLITKDNVTIPAKQYFNLLAANSLFNGSMLKPMDEKNQVWTGKQALSEVIPKNININMKLENNDGTDNVVKIKEGVIEKGVFTKGVYQSQTAGLVQTVYNENGMEATRHLFDNTQKLICDWLVYNGFSVGISDLIVSQEAKDKMKEVNTDMTTQVSEIIRDIHEGKFVNNSIFSTHQVFEEKVSGLLSGAVKNIGKIGLSNIHSSNRLTTMVTAGSKGSAINIAQMISSLGQQSVENKRIEDGFDNRSLPHYTKYNESPEARGWVESSFIKGLNPQEMFFHSIAGRIGLILKPISSIY